MLNKNKKTSFVSLISNSAASIAILGLATTGASAQQLTGAPSLNTYVNIVGELSFQHDETLVPSQPNLDFAGIGGLIIQRGLDGTENRAEVFVEDPLSQLVEAKVIADAPRDGDFSAEVLLIDQTGETFELFISPDKATLPAVVQSTRSFNKSLNLNAGVDYAVGPYTVGGAISFSVDDIANSDTAEIGGAFVYAASREYGTIRAGRNLSLPFSTRSPQVISGGTFSFADFGDYQVSYVSPVWSGFRAGVLAGKAADGSISLAGTAQYQLTFGDHQARLAGYADSAKSWQTVAGYTYRYAPSGFAGLTVRYGRDGGLESFASLEASLQHQRHSLSANFERAWSNNLDLLYANNNQAFFSVSIRDTEGFNREDRLGVGYSYTYNNNLQMFANARLIRHKFYPSRKEISAGLRIAF